MPKTFEYGSWDEIREKILPDLGEAVEYDLNHRGTQWYQGDTLKVTIIVDTIPEDK